MTILRELLRWLLNLGGAPSPPFDDAPRKLFEGEVCWIGDTRISDCCRRYYRAMVIERAGELYPALHYLTMDGIEEVTTASATNDMTDAREQANALLPT
nr:hypothetical protein [Stenotrophomonas pavanii]